MKLLIQNLHKEKHLVCDLIQQHSEPDIMLVQEVNIKSEDDNIIINRYGYDYASFTSRMGYGTAIYALKKDKKGSNNNNDSNNNSNKNDNNKILTNIRHVKSPHNETGGMISKKTTIATYDNKVELVSFHGYNGQPFKNIQYLVDHVMAVLQVLSSDKASAPAIFGGDFNTWSIEHVNAVSKVLQEAGFTLAYSWPYPNRSVALDHVYVRNGTGIKIKVGESSIYSNKSDHNGIIIELEIS